MLCAAMIFTTVTTLLRHLARAQKRKTNLRSHDLKKYRKRNKYIQKQTFQPLSHANLDVLKTSPEKPGDWDLKPGDFQNMCQIIKKALFV